ncbi:MAG: hypothetical protein HYV02_08795 [Deltaproteobacteria bacterium]|nr:hypothetical protein [Deltaproteobacteria bacterium]
MLSALLWLASLFHVNDLPPLSKIDPLVYHMRAVAPATAVGTMVTCGYFLTMKMIPS